MSQPVGPGISARRVVIVGNSSTALLVVDKDGSRVLNVDASTKEADLTGTLVIKNPDDEQEQLVIGYSEGVLTQDASHQQIGSRDTSTAVSTNIVAPTTVIRISADETTFTDITSQFEDPQTSVQLFTAENETVAFGFDTSAVTNLMWITPIPGDVSSRCLITYGDNLAQLGTRPFSVKDFTGLNRPDAFRSSSLYSGGPRGPLIANTGARYGTSGGTINGVQADSWILIKLSELNGPVENIRFNNVYGLGNGILFPGSGRLRVGYRREYSTRNMLPVAGTGSTTEAWYGTVPLSFPGNTLSAPAEYVDFTVVVPQTLDPAQVPIMVLQTANPSGAAISATVSYEICVAMSSQTVAAASSPPTADQFVSSGTTSVFVSANSTGSRSIFLNDLPPNYLTTQADPIIAARITLTSTNGPLVFTGAIVQYWDSVD